MVDKSASKLMSSYYMLVNITLSWFITWHLVCHGHCIIS